MTTTPPISPTSLFTDVGVTDVAMAALSALQVELETLLERAAASPTVFQECQQAAKSLAPIVKSQLEIVLAQTTSETAKAHIASCVTPLVDLATLVGLKLATSLLSTWLMTYVSPSSLQQFIDERQSEISLDSTRAHQKPGTLGTYL